MESILEHKVLQTENEEEFILYLVKWVNFAVSESTWQDEYSFKGSGALQILRSYQAAHDIEQVPIHDNSNVPAIGNPAILWQELFEAGHVSTSQPVDLESFMAFPAGTKRCSPMQSGTCENAFASSS